MSKSYHTTIKDFKGKTKKELDEMAKDPDSKLSEWAEKCKVKKEVLKERRNKKTAKEKRAITSYDHVRLAIAKSARYSQSVVVHSSDSSPKLQN